MRNLAFDTVNSSHKEIETLRKSLVETKEQLSERRAVAESLSIAFNKSDSEKRGLQLQLEQLTQDSQKTLAALQASEQANLAFQQRLDDLEASVSAERLRAEQTLQSSQDQLQAAVGEHRRLQQQLDEVTDAHKTASAAVELMKRESMSLEALGKDNTNFREDMSSRASAGTSNQQLHFQKKEESEELRGATSELATTQRKLVSAERQLELLQQDVETLRTKLSKEGYHSKKASMKAWSTEVGRATLQDILTETNEQLKNTQEQLGQVQAKLASTEQELHGQTFDAAMALLEAEQTHGTLERGLHAQIHELERSALLRQEEAVQGTEAQLERHAARVRELEELLSQKESDLQETVIEVKNILQRMEFETEKWSRSRRKAEKLFGQFSPVSIESTFGLFRTVARWNILTPEEREMAEERLKTSLKSCTKHQRQPADT
ncbi:hypothetical protein DL96DRAFT_1042452 [Flagelloscypha sp. PMI_526]|nr:hypothetical protein DL96DRAFT_1042452 [Flagelloscypha sp. PMI_526]